MNHSDMIQVLDNLGELNEAQLAVLRTLPAPERPLPGKRSLDRFSLAVGGHSFHLDIGRYPSGQIGEIFLSTGKDGAAFRAMLDCFCMSVSVGLQHGIPLERFIELFKGQKFEPNGYVTGYATPLTADSIIDAVFQVVEAENVPPPR